MSAEEIAKLMGKPVMRWEVDWLHGYVWVRFEAVHRWWHYFVAPAEFYAKLTRVQAKGLGTLLVKLASEPEPEQRHER